MLPLSCFPHTITCHVTNIQYSHICVFSFYITQIFLESPSINHLQHRVRLVNCIKMIFLYFPTFLKLPQGSNSLIINSLTAPNSSHPAKQAFVFVVFLFLNIYPIFDVAGKRHFLLPSEVSCSFFKPLLNIPNIPYIFFSLFPSTEIHKNLISPLEGDTKEEKLHKKHTDLKQKMKDINHGFERLRKLSHEGFTEDSGERGGNHRTRPGPSSKRLRCPLAASWAVIGFIRKRFWGKKKKGQKSASGQCWTADPGNVELFISGNIHFPSSESFPCSVLRV